MTDTPATDIAAVSWGPNRLDLVIRAANGEVLHKAWDHGTWYPPLTDWEPLGGVIAGAPAVTSRGPERLDIVARGPDGRVFHKAWDTGRWSPSQTGWDSLGGNLRVAPAVVSWGPSRLDVFGVAGHDYYVCHTAWTGKGWSAWEPLPHHIYHYQRLPVIALGSNRLAVAGYASSPPGPARTLPLLEWDGRVQLPAWQVQHWSAWQVPDTQLATKALAFSSWGPERLDIVYSGWGGGVLHRAREGDYWYPVDSLGSDISESPDSLAVTSWGPQRLDVVVRDKHDQLAHIAWNGERWQAWEPLGGVARGGPTVIATRPYDLHILVCGADGGVWHRVGDGTQWADWEPLGGHLLSTPPPIPGG